jgi:PTH1 family peptidyl-tRNA hydrolase
MPKLVVALGNPGPEYEFTRHNIGWLALDHLSDLDGKHWKEKFKGIYTDATIAGEKVYFLKPQTFMNLSGESVQPLISFFKIDVKDILVVYDELDLPLGQMQFKSGGGLAGHNGLKSMAKCLGNQNFQRLRLGIGRPQHGSVSNWVLSSFRKEEEILLADVLRTAADGIVDYLKSDIKKVSTKYNRKDLILGK